MPYERRPSYLTLRTGKLISVGVPFVWVATEGEGHKLEFEALSLLSIGCTLCLREQDLANPTPLDTPSMVATIGSLVTKVPENLGCNDAHTLALLHNSMLTCCWSFGFPVFICAQCKNGFDMRL